MPGIGAAFGFVSAWQLSGDDGRPQLPFGQIVGGVDEVVVEEREEVVDLFGEAFADTFFALDFAGLVQQLCCKDLEQASIVLERL